MSAYLRIGTCIIEHNTRGTLVERLMDPVDDKWIFRFRFTGSRDDPDTAMHFYNHREADKMWRSMPVNLMEKCKILMWDGDIWKVIRFIEAT